MSIQTIREQLQGIPGAERIVMRYEGEQQIFSIDDISVTVSPAATPDEIRAAFLEAMAPKKAAVKKAVAKKPAKKRGK